MSQKNRSGSEGSPCSCELTWLRRRRELEDTPTTHIDARSRDASVHCCGCCQNAGLAALLEEQNRLLA